MNCANADEPRGAGRPGTTRVLIAENETLFRELLSNALAGHPNIVVVGAAETGDSALDLADRTSPDVVLMGIEHGSEQDGLRAAHLIKAAHPSVGIVILSMRHDRERLATLPEKRAGGWSFLLRQSVADSSALVRAIEGAASGLVSMDPALIEDLYPRKRSALERLTQEQLSVLQHMAAGLADRAIAETLRMSEGGVRRLIRTISNDLHIEADDRVDQRVRLILTYLRETSEHAGV